jgi:pheromone shutdown protein TraB
LVAVELDMARLRSLGKKRKLTLSQALKSGRPEALAYFLLQGFQTKAGKAMGVKPGRDMVVAVREANAHGIPVFLIDRDVRITMRRLTRQLTLKEKLNIVQSLIMGAIGLSKEDINSVLDNKDALMVEFKKELPSAYKVLVSERDEYMASMLLQTPPGRVLVVIGAGHLAGLRRELTRQFTRRLT